MENELDEAVKEQKKKEDAKKKVEDALLKMQGTLGGLKPDAS